MKAHLVLVLLVLASGVRAKADLLATDDISTLKAYEGQYRIDPKTDPYAAGCADNYNQLSLSVDEQAQSLSLVFEGNNSGNNPIPNGVPQVTEVSLKNTYDIPSFPFSAKGRVVLEGLTVVEQLESVDTLGFWTTGNTLMTFAGGNSIVLPPYNCRFIKSVQ